MCSRRLPSLAVFLFGLTTLVLSLVLPFCSAATTQVLINDGNSFSNSPTVTLSLNATSVFARSAYPGTFTEMSINNSDSSAWTNWETFKVSKTWALSSGDGLKNVYVKFRIIIDYHAGVPIYETSPAYQASITLDTTPPTVNFTNPGHNGTQTNSSDLQVTWAATDTGSGLSYIEVVDANGNSANVGTNTTYALTGLGNGNYTFIVRAVDNAGNAATSLVNFTVNLAQQPPTSQTGTSSPTSPSSINTPTPTAVSNASPLPPWLPIALVGGIACAVGVAAPVLVYERRKKGNDKQQKKKGALPDPLPKPTQGSTGALPDPLPKPTQGSTGALPEPIPKPTQGGTGALPDPIPKPTQGRKNRKRNLNKANANT